MPEEFSRTTKRKRIIIGTSFVDVPVITEISFIDPNDRYQEWHYTIDNSGQSNRIVHVDTITSTTDTQQLNVERIDTWSTIDSVDRGQETQLSMDNVTGADSVPPHFSTHLATHVVRYKNPDDASVWIDSELIDSFSVLDPNDRYQETVFNLNNPETDDEAQADPNDEEISDQFAGVDPPWRTDPFQNIINLQGPAGSIIAQIFVFRRWGENCNAAKLAVLQDTVDGTNGGQWYPVDADQWITWEQNGETYPAATSISTEGAGSSIPRMRAVASRTLLSDLITACATLSHQFGQTPSSLDGGEGRNPWIEWLNFGSLGFLDCSEGLIDPVDVEQPSAGNASHSFEDPPGSGIFKPFPIYVGVIGYASVDDLPTSGPTFPPYTPPFIPPT